MTDRVKTENKIALIPVFRINPRSQPPRRGYSRKELSSLSRSIEKNGILQPLIVRDVSFGEYELITGERRLRAAVMAGLTSVPCIIFHCSQKQSAVYSIIENLQRDDPDPFARAETINFLISDIGFSVERTARQLGVSEKTVLNYLKILNFSPSEKNVITEQGLSILYASELIKISDESLRKKILERVVEESLSVVETSQLVFELTDGKEDPHSRIEKFIIKDMRLFSNTIQHVVTTMRRAGLNALLEHTEDDGYIEYKIRITKTK